MSGDPWVRNGAVERVIDGDSLVVLVDLGYRAYLKARIRLLGIDTPERGEPGWAEARDNLAALAPAGAACVVTTVGPDKYGDRWDGTVTVNGVDLAQAQLAAGLGVPYSGGAR